MDADKIILAVLIFSLFITVSVLFISDVNTNYSEVEMSTDDFSGVYETSGEIYNLTEDMKGFIVGGEVDEDSTENSMFKGVYSGLKLMITPLRLIGDMANGIANTIPISTEVNLGGNKINISTIFVTYAVAIIAIMIIFALAYLIFRIAKG